MNGFTRPTPSDRHHSCATSDARTAPPPQESHDEPHPPALASRHLLLARPRASFESPRRAEAPRGRVPHARAALVMSTTMRLSISADPEPDGGEIIMETSDIVAASANGFDAHVSVAASSSAAASSVNSSSAASTTANYAPAPAFTPRHAPIVIDSDAADASPVPEFDNKRAKIQYFSRDCTAITDYLYVSGMKVASSESKLREKNITHIVNCCGDVCDNYFPDSFHYLKLHLLDSAQEDITCVLYKVIDFIDTARKGKNRVLVHCQQVHDTYTRIDT